MTAATLTSHTTAFQIIEREPGRLTQTERDQLRELRSYIDSLLAHDQRLSMPPMACPAPPPPNAGLSTTDHRES